MVGGHRVPTGLGRIDALLDSHGPPIVARDRLELGGGLGRRVPALHDRAGQGQATPRLVAEVILESTRARGEEVDEVLDVDVRRRRHALWLAEEERPRGGALGGHRVGAVGRNLQHGGGGGGREVRPPAGGRCGCETEVKRSSEVAPWDVATSCGRSGSIIRAVHFLPLTRPLHPGTHHRTQGSLVGKQYRLGVLRRIVVTGLAVALVAWAAPTPAADVEGTGVNIAHIANIPWGADVVGTDMEFATIGGHDYAFAGTYLSGLKAVDVTDPARPQLVSSYDCAISQGDVQLFSRDGRTYGTYTSDDGYTVDTKSQCFLDARVSVGNPYGTFIVDVTDPAAMKAISFVPIARGSHNTTVHPSGRWLYNSNAELQNPLGVVEIVDINDLAHPKVHRTVPLITGASAHDITFSKDGTRAYVAALTHTLIFDTTDPADPTIIGRILDPTVNLHHGADPIAIARPDGTTREFLLVVDELAGAAGNLVCPGGGIHVYDIDEGLERAPIKVGAYFIPQLRDRRRRLDHLHGARHADPRAGAAHDDRVVRRRVHVLDLSRLGLGRYSPSLGELTGAGIREVGSYRFPDSDTWSAKTNKIAADGSFYLFGNDYRRGFDVYHYVPSSSGPARDVGTDGTRWLTLDQLRLPVVPDGYQPRCLIRPTAKARD